MGGEFEVYEYLDDNKIFEDLKRFPDDKKVRLVDKFSPKSGQLFFFYLPLTHIMESQNLYQTMKTEFLYTVVIH